MTLRFAIVFMSGLAVVSDAILIAFYPQFFERRYGVTSAVHVGAYVAAISLAVMCTLPLWARVARRIETMHLLVWTQGAAGVLCAASYWADTPLAYWLLTMPMFMCKSSYLLMFPYLMRLQTPEQHSATVGLLSVVVHLGSIFGAVAGGLVMHRFGPETCLWLMAAGDFGQMLISRHLIRSGKVVRVNGGTPASTQRRGLRGTGLVVLKLCFVMLVFDLSAHLVSPFFSVHWEQVSGIADQAVSGAVFAIPGFVALAAMVINRRSSARGARVFDHLQANLLLGAIGLSMQAVPHEVVMLLGRALYGWALFQTIVKLEVSVFKLSTPDAYAVDYSLANFFQNLGVLLASFAAGAIVGRWGAQVTFVLGAAGLLLAALMDRVLLGVDRLPPAEAVKTMGVPSHAS